MTPPLALAPVPAEVVWASGAAVAAALLFVARRARRAAAPPPSVAERVAAFGPPVEDVEGALQWLPPDAAAHDRRRAQRRGGAVTPAWLAVTPSGKRMEAVVADRSSGGLCLAVGRAYRDGMPLFVRPAAAADDCPWVAVTARHCRPCSDYFLLGVQFVDTPPWNVLLQFG